MPQPIAEKKYENLNVKVFNNKEELGVAAAQAAAERIQEIVATKEHANLLFSTGASQFEFVAALKDVGVDWKQIHAFHLDEYKAMADDHPASFRLWLRTRVDEPLKPASFHYIEGDAADVEAECHRYEELLRANPINLGFIGIGENGHIAFNDPPVADFNDSKLVKVVELDEACRRQQLGEGWFPTIDDVPREAITLTVPAIMRSERIISVVPDERKAQAVKDALEGPIETACPASILRTHNDVTLFLDQGSASKLSL